MSDISAWANSAGGNTAASPNGFPEGMMPSGVNDGMREVMAAVRRQGESAEWFNWGYTPTFATTASFTLAGDRSALYHANRRVKALDGASTLYGTISDVTYSANTRVSVTLDSGQLSSSLSSVSIAILSFTNQSIPKAMSVSFATSASYASSALWAASASAASTADLLDGFHASQTTGNDTIPVSQAGGTLTWSAVASSLTITPKIVTANGNLEITPDGNANIIMPGSGTGRVGIRTLTPNSPLEVAGDFDVSDGGGTERNRIQIAWHPVGGYGYLDVYKYGTSAGGRPLVLNPNGGNIGIAVVPTARLHIPASTSATATGALKFETGLLLATPENGLVEFDGTHYYGTAGGVRHQLDQDNSAIYANSASYASSALWAASASAAATVGGFVPSQTPGADNVLVYNSSAVLAAGTVPLARMMRVQASAENAGIVSLSAEVALSSINLPTVVSGDRILVSAYTQVSKGAVAGLTSLNISKSAGTATYLFGYNTGNGPGDAFYQEASGLYTKHLSGVLQINGSGSLTLQLSGSSVGSEAAIAAGSGEIHAIVLNNG